MGQPIRVGIIGCGAISTQYLTTFDALADVTLIAVADQDPLRAEAVAAQRLGVRCCTVEELMAIVNIDLVVNLTIPAAHADIALQAIAAGKAVYGEKPLVTTTADARQILEAAAAAGVVVGCAPTQCWEPGFKPPAPQSTTV